MSLFTRSIFPHQYVQMVHGSNAKNLARFRPQINFTWQPLQREIIELQKSQDVECPNGLWIQCWQIRHDKGLAVIFTLLYVQEVVTLQKKY